VNPTLEQMTAAVSLADQIAHIEFCAEEAKHVGYAEQATELAVLATLRSHAALLSLVERYASECKCGGTGIGRVVHSVQGGEIIETGLACEDCADIRAAIASAKGDK
jgi:hypothetical protein